MGASQASADLHAAVESHAGAAARPTNGRTDRVCRQPWYPSAGELRLQHLPADCAEHGRAASVVQRYNHAILSSCGCGARGCRSVSLLADGKPGLVGVVEFGLQLTAGQDRSSLLAWLLSAYELYLEQADGRLLLRLGRFLVPRCPRSGLL